MGLLYRGVPHRGIRYTGVFVSYGFVASKCLLHRGSLYRDVPYITVIPYITASYTGVFLT